MRSNLQADLERMLSKKCIGAIGGEGNGSMITIHLRNLVRRNQPLLNDKISEELRRNKGEYCIFVKGCSWRMEGDSSVVCSSKNSEAEIASWLDKLSGLEITSIIITNSALDLEVKFGTSYVITLFCDETADDLENYKIRIPGGWYSVNSRSSLTFK